MDYFLKKYPENENFIRFLFDVLNNLERYQNKYHFDFLNPLEQLIVKEVALKYPSFSFNFNDDAFSFERKQLLINDTNFDIAIVSFSYNSKFNKIDHKDLLGSLMSLGFDRKKFGDLYIKDGYGEIAFINSIKDYLMNNFNKVANTPISLKEIKCFTLKSNYSEKEVITSSLRVDCLVSNLFKISRSQAKKFIEEGYVQLNYKIVENPSLLCNNVNMVISLKRYGKVKIEEVLNTTKNHKIVLKVLYYS